MIRRLTGPLTAVVAAIVVLLVALAVASPASAAQLSVTNSHPVINTAARCSTATIATTAPSASAASTTLRMSNLPAACAGLPVAVSVVGTNGTVLATGTLASAATGTNNVTVSSYNTTNVASVAVFVNTWWINSTWTAPTPAPAISCTSLALDGTPTGVPCTTGTPSIATWGGQGSSPFYTNGTVQVNTTSPNYEVVINFADTSLFPGWTPVSVMTNTDSIAAPNYSCTELPILRLQRNITTSSFVVYFSVTTKDNAYNFDKDRICG